MTQPHSILFALLSFAAASTASAAEIDVLASAALGDELGGRPSAIDVLDDGTIVLAGADDRGGTLVRLDSSGVAVGPVTRFAEAVDDAAIDRRTGRIAVVTGAELLLVADDGQIVGRAVLPARAATERRRVAVGELGTIAVVAADELHTFTADGDPLGHTVLSDETTSAVAVLDADDLVVTTGWSRGCDDGVDVAAIDGYARDGALRWRAYGDVDAAALCESDVAGTRGVDVARGEDGMVYLLAEVDGAQNRFRTRPDAPTEAAANVAFDPMTTTEGASSARFAYYARFTPAGEHVLGQWLLMPDEDAVVQPAAIAADARGNVALTGTTSHALAHDEDMVHAEALYAPAGFHALVRADFRERLAWQSLEIDDTSTAGVALALAGAHVVTLIHASRLPSADDSSPAGPMVLTFPTDPKHDVPRRPDRDDIGTFGYESGVAGSDPTCYACGPTRAPGPAGTLALGLLVLAARRRRERAIVKLRPRDRGLQSRSRTR